MIHFLQRMIRHFVNTTHDLMDVYKNYNGKVGDTKETFEDTDGNDNDNEVYDLEKSNEVIISTIERSQVWWVISITL